MIVVNSKSLEKPTYLNPIIDLLQLSRSESILDPIFLLKVFLNREKERKKP